MSHQIDHVFINEHGVFVIETKNYFGVIEIENESSWIKIVKGERIRISNPLKQNKSHAVIISRLLDKKYDVVPVVVFVRDNAPYTGDDNAINLKDLNLFIDSHPYKKLLSKEEIDLIAKKLIKASSEISTNRHVENITYLKQVKEESRKEIEYALMRRKCPRCGHKIIERNNIYRCENCDFKFKL